MQEKEQHRLRNEKEAMDNEMLGLEKNYASLQEEVEGLRANLKIVRGKYKLAIRDIKDINNEQELAREDLLETIRTQDKEVKFAKAVM